MPHRIFVPCVGLLLLSLLTSPASGQLGSRPAEEWIKTLDGPVRVAGMKIDEVVAALTLQPGQTVADIGAGSGLLAAPLAAAVGPRGRIYAVEIDAEFFPEIRRRAATAQVTNVETVLGRFTDPSLPVKSIDVALFHDVIHHVEDREAYLETLAGYLAPSGRIVVIDYEGGMGPHRDQPELEVTRGQLAGWMTRAGFSQVEDVKLFPDKYFLVFARREATRRPGTAAPTSTVELVQVAGDRRPSSDQRQPVIIPSSVSVSRSSRRPCSSAAIRMRSPRKSST